MFRRESKAEPGKKNALQWSAPAAAAAYLFGDEQESSLVEWIVAQCIGGAVEKEAGEDGHGDGVKERRPEGDHQGDEHVNGDARHPGLSHSQHRKALHRTGVVGVGKGDHIGECPCVHRRVRQNAVHPGKAKEREEDVEQSNHQQVPVVGVTLGQSVWGSTDQRRRDVLVDEEENGKGKAEHCREENGGRGQTVQCGEAPAVIGAHFKAVRWKRKKEKRRSWWFAKWSN